MNERELVVEKDDPPASSLLAGRWVVFFYDKLRQEFIF
jgi:hypothetical protein